MEKDRIDCISHEILQGLAISEDTTRPGLKILTSPYLPGSVLPAEIFPSGVIYSEKEGEKPWSTSLLSNREVSGNQVETQVSRDINREMFVHPFTPHAAVVEKYPDENGKDGHWHIHMSPYMDRISHKEIYDFLQQFDPLVRDTIGREVAMAAPVCEFGEDEIIQYNASAVEIEIDEDGECTARVGLVTSAGPEDEVVVTPFADNSYPGRYIYKISADLQDVFPFLADLPAPDWDITLGLAINDCEDLYDVFRYVTSKKEGFTSSEVYKYIRPFMKIRKKEEGGVE